MTSLELVRLVPLMERASGNESIKIGLIDGPLVLAHPDLAESRIQQVPGEQRAGCSQANSRACRHGTLMAGILVARRGSPAPAICPGCTLLARPIFSETIVTSSAMPSATAPVLARAMLDCMDAGANILNLSVAIAGPSTRGDRELQEALDQSARTGVLVVAAAGNQSMLGSSVITRHPWVIPVSACDLQGRPMLVSNLGPSIGRHGVAAPGEGVFSLGVDGPPLGVAGTSPAAAIVTGAIALVWSEHPRASAAEIRLVVREMGGVRRNAITPPLLNAWAMYTLLATRRFAA